MHKRLSVLGAALFSATLTVSLTACNSGTTTPPKSEKSSEGSQDSSSDSNKKEPKAHGADVDFALTAMKTAEAEVDGGSVSELEFEESDNEWEVTVLTESQSIDLNISRDGSAVVDKDKPDSTDADTLQAIEDANVDFGMALKSAFDHTEGNVDEAGMENEGETPMWNVDMYPKGETNAVKLQIDTDSGDVTER
jgi:hypothetical protein